MALPQYDDPGPIPPELMDEQLDDDADRRLLGETLWFADDHAIDVAAAIEMLADAEPERWRIRDDDGAEWALRKLAEATAELDALRARATAWQERIEAWFAQAAKEPAQTAEYFTAHIEWYARQQRAELDRKSFALPSGKVTSRSTAACAEIVDEAAVLAWVDRAHGPERAAVAPPQPRKAYVSELRKVTSVVEIVDRARLTLSDGEIIEWVRGSADESLVTGSVDAIIADAADGTTTIEVGELCPKVGDGWPSPEEAEALVGLVETIDSHLAVVDAEGVSVPGVAVRPEQVSVTVSVEP